MKSPLNQRGSALLLVLWAIITMSVAVLGVVEYVHYNLDETEGLNLNFELRQLAQSGIAIASSPQVKEGDPILNGTVGDEGRYEVVLKSETARFNINRILMTGREDILERLFVIWKAPSSDARHAVAQLIEWTGRTGDAADNYSMERDFTSVEQMSEADGMDKIAALNPDWASAFTIWGNGRLDVNDASADILQAFFGIGERKAESFVQSRSGPDKKEHTLDDVRYENKNILAAALGLPVKQFDSYERGVSYDTQLSRVESTGIIGEKRREIRVIFNRKTQPPEIYQWQEVPL